MTTSTQQPAGHRAAAWVFVVLGGLLLGMAAAALDADAARLGGLTSPQIFGRSYHYGAISSQFSQPAGTSLDKAFIDCGNKWTLGGGPMTITSAGTLVSAREVMVTASVPLCVDTGPNSEAGGDLRPTSTTRFGVLVHADTGGKPATAAVYDAAAGAVLLQRISGGGTVTTWAQVTGITGGTAVRHLRLSYRTGVYRVEMDGTVLITHTVPDAATRSSVEASRAVGVVAFSDITTTFDNFQGYGL